MESKRGVVGLAVVIALLATTAASVGLFRVGGVGRTAFQTLRGDTALIYGEGLYRHDTVFVGSGNRGVDATILFVGVPLLIVAVFVYSRTHRIGRLVLLIPMAFLAYAYMWLATGAAYNELFLLYVVLFSASFYGFVTLFARSVSDRPEADHVARLPRRGLAALLLASGVLTLCVWVEPVASALAAGRAPDLLDSYTTLVTYAVDLALITPATVLAAGLILRRRWLGYVIAIPLLGLLAVLLPQIVSQTAFQLRAGIELTPAQIAGPVAGFAILGLIALGFLIVLGSRLARNPGFRQR
ncbi:MAG: hypothetical protein PHU43_03910 [Candidatus Bipolaricaulis sp.]|nr:hypothetical protein [Candidatus Bipolaricaulis sp.]